MNRILTLVTLKTLILLMLAFFLGSGATVYALTQFGQRVITVITDQVFNMAVTPGDVTLHGLPGQVVSDTTALTNNGNGPDTYTVTKSEVVTVGTLPAASWNGALSKAGGSVAAGANDTVGYQVTIPAGSLPGDTFQATVQFFR